MTIQTPETDASEMTRREAYDQMIENCCKLLDLTHRLDDDKKELDKLQSAKPNFHSVSSFDELEAMEQLVDELQPKIDACRERVNDLEIEIRDLHESCCDIIRSYGFARVSYIFFEHNSNKWYMPVTKFMKNNNELRVDIKADKS